MTTVWQNHKHGRILEGMSILVKATPAPAPRTKESRQIALLYAGLLTVFVVAQLFTFDEFIELIPTFQLPLGEVLPYAIAPLLVAAEIFALPFLLGMAVSPAFRWLSMGCGWVAAGLWAFISIWVVSVHPNVETVGFLGTLVSPAPGWWAVCISIALCLLAVWTSWGLWPGRRKK